MQRLRRHPTAAHDRSEELRWMLENSPYIAGAKPEEKQQFVEKIKHRISDMSIDPK